VRTVVRITMHVAEVRLRRIVIGGKQAGGCRWDLPGFADTAHSLRLLDFSTPQGMFWSASSDDVLFYIFLTKLLQNMGKFRKM
jgi:hypothetical protein